MNVIAKEIFEFGLILAKLDWTLYEIEKYNGKVHSWIVIDEDWIV
jgi:hypothetical protein